MALLFTSALLAVTTVNATIEIKGINQRKTKPGVVHNWSNQKSRKDFFHEGERERSGVGKDRRRRRQDLTPYYRCEGDGDKSGKKGIASGKKSGKKGSTLSTKSGKKGTYEMASKSGKKGLRALTSKNSKSGKKGRTLQKRHGGVERKENPQKQQRGIERREKALKENTERDMV
eukprot:5167436-Ditylum_brightwellii.AAC.1